MKEGLDVLTEKKAVTFFLVNKHFEEKSIKRGAGLFQEGGMARRGGGQHPYAHYGNRPIECIYHIMINFRSTLRKERQFR